jgi:hypothetical protein
VNWFSDNWKFLFDGVGGTFVGGLASFLLNKWFDSRKDSTGKQTKVTNSQIVSGSENVQTVHSPTIHGGVVNYAPIVSVTSHSDSIRKFRFVIYAVIVPVAFLGGFVSADLLTTRMPGAVKPVPTADKHGHPQPSDANRDELAVRELQDEISDLIEHKDRVRYSNFDRQQLRNAGYLAERMLAFSDAYLRLRYRYVKYEYAAFALEMAAVFVMPDDHPKAAEYATKAINNADTALLLLKQAEGAYQFDEESRVLLDWVNKEDFGKDRVLYIKADAACLLGKLKNDPTLKSQALETWNQIIPTYRADYPAKGTPELSGCVPTT